jgi:hypothetical protein
VAQAWWAEKQKTSSGVRCVHIASGAGGKAIELMVGSAFGESEDKNLKTLNLKD